jgi:hypothetical protein
LLIECKQSRHPYLFFESVAPPELTVPLPRLLSDGGGAHLGPSTTSPR